MSKYVLKLHVVIEDEWEIYADSMAEADSEAQEILDEYMSDIKFDLKDEDNYEIEEVDDDDEE